MVKIVLQMVMKSLNTFTIEIILFSLQRLFICPVSAFAALEAVTLLTIQCARRFYETQYIQVFSGQSKINFTHYIVGYFHYFGAFLVILSQAPGFVRNPKPEDEIFIHIDQVLPYNLSMMFLFFVAWYQQCRANVMLANLRKNRSGRQ